MRHALMTPSHTSCTLKDNRRQYDRLSTRLGREGVSMLSDAKAAIDDVRRELRGQGAGAAKLAAIEARLSSLEGSILSSGKRDGGQQCLFKTCSFRACAHSACGYAHRCSLHGKLG